MAHDNPIQDAPNGAKAIKIYDAAWEFDRARYFHPGDVEIPRELWFGEHNFATTNKQHAIDVAYESFKMAANLVLDYCDRMNKTLSEQLAVLRDNIEKQENTPSADVTAEELAHWKEEETWRQRALKVSWDAHKKLSSDMLRYSNRENFRRDICRQGWAEIEIGEASIFTVQIYDQTLELTKDIIAELTGQNQETDKAVQNIDDNIEH